MVQREVSEWRRLSFNSGGIRARRKAGFTKGTGFVCLRPAAARLHPSCQPRAAMRTRGARRPWGSCRCGPGGLRRRHPPAAGPRAWSVPRGLEKMTSGPRHVCLLLHSAIVLGWLLPRCPPLLPRRSLLHPQCPFSLPGVPHGPSRPRTEAVSCVPAVPLPRWLPRRRVARADDVRRRAAVNDL